MYSKQEAAQLKQQFWTAFGQYMRPVLPAGDEKVNWVNYKTGEKDIYFRLQAGNRQASVGIELKHKDEGLQALYYEQLEQLKPMLHARLQETWIWQPLAYDEHGKKISRVYNELQGVSVFNQGDWPQLISFFKPRIVALDAFWNDAKTIFEGMR